MGFDLDASRDVVHQRDRALVLAGLVEDRRGVDLGYEGRSIDSAQLLHEPQSTAGPHHRAALLGDLDLLRTEEVEDGSGEELVDGAAH